ncbi:hypothetical protein KW805_03210 [Candidatus Pacearchaeota archaeon]|nr:hypothetical protein [Candidatus Pacearchaeota archaeon]
MKSLHKVTLYKSMDSVFPRESSLKNLVKDGTPILAFNNKDRSIEHLPVLFISNGKFWNFEPDEQLISYAAAQIQFSAHASASLSVPNFFQHKKLEVHWRGKYSKLYPPLDDAGLSRGPLGLDFGGRLGDIIWTYDDSFQRRVYGTNPSHYSPTHLLIGDEVGPSIREYIRNRGYLAPEVLSPV